jgi:Fe-S oxidoreductase
MESLNQNRTHVAQEKFAQVLNLLGANGAWWYGLYKTNKDETNMLDLLGVDSITLSRIYEVCGFTYAVKGARKVRFNKGMFDAFKINHNLDIEVEMTVRSYYFRIGSFRSETGVFSMQGQKKMGIL